jgi:hypothetical protein
MLVVSVTAPAQTPLGSEFQVNTYTTGHQLTPAVVSDASGNFVVVWQNGWSPSSDISFRRFASDGSPLGGESAVPSSDVSPPDNPAVASAPDGRFVVVWHDYYYGPETIRGHLFASDGSAAGSWFLVSNQGYDLADPSVDMDDGGGFVVAWSRYGDIAARRFDSAGTRLGSRLSVNTYTTGQQGDPSIAVEADGDFIVVWDRNVPDSPPNEPIVARRYASDGSPSGVEFQVSTYQQWAASPSVTQDPSGHFVVAWSDYLGGGPGYNGILGREVSSSGAVQGTDFTISTETEWAHHPSVSAGSDGHFLVAWVSLHGGESEVRGREILADGTPVNDAFQVYAYATGYQNFPSVAGANGQFVVVWQGTASTGIDYDWNIQGQRLMGHALVFADGFESGDTNAWSTTIGGP